MHMADVTFDIECVYCMIIIKPSNAEHVHVLLFRIVYLINQHCSINALTVCCPQQSNF